VKRAALALLLCAGCASALHKPPPIEAVAAAPQEGADQLLERAEAAWARRSEPGQAGAAEELYLEAARADPRRPESFAGAIRAKAFRLGREKNGGERQRLAQGAVEVGQLCQQHAPAAPVCDYWLAAALGLQARERSATAKDGLPRMVDLLRRAARADPAIDHGGPHRLLATVLLRAPGWPLGPGDPDGALPEAQAAVRTEPEFAPNQLVLGEALRYKGDAAGARSAYSKALRLATDAAGRGDPDASGWVDDAKAALRDLATGTQLSSATVTTA
jgi:tetratricopeptide (TPR) repeat protein